MQTEARSGDGGGVKWNVVVVEKPLKLADPGGKAGGEARELGGKLRYLVDQQGHHQDDNRRQADEQHEINNRRATGAADRQTGLEEAHHGKQGESQEPGQKK